MTGIAYQYALAVFSLAEEANQVEEFKNDITEFAKSLDEEKHKFFAHPKIDKSDKRAIIDNVVKNNLVKNFLKVLVDNDRVMIIDAIILAYQDILDNLNKVMKVEVYSNKTLSKSNIEKIKSKLNKSYKRKIEIEEKQDLSIIGGYRLEFEGNIIDETINKQLDNIKSSLLE